MRPPHRAHEVRDRGLGLVEVVVAVILLGILSTAVLAIVLRAQEQTVNNRSRVAASNLAARELDLVREQFAASKNGPLDLAAEGVVVNPHSFGPPGSALEVDGMVYTVRRSAAWNITGVGSSACEGGSIVEQPTLGVRVEVTWPDMGQTKPVSTSAQLAPPKGTGVSGETAFVAVKVTDARGEPNPGRRVIVSASGGGETRANVTDEAGCAVLEVHPAASGTDYTAQVSDAGHVDLAGDPAPSRQVGRMEKGTLNSAIDFAYDRAATLEVQLTGPGVRDSDLTGSQITLSKGGAYAGASPLTTHYATGRRTTVAGLWPGDYAAFFGTDVPAALEYTSLPPGGSVRVNVAITMAEFRVQGVPDGGDVIAVPGAATSCGDPNGRKVDASAGRLMAGTWSLLAETEAYGCVSGPASLSLAPGPNEDVVWAESRLRVTNVPEGYGSTVWAVPVDAATQACRAPSGKYSAIELGSPPGAIGALPAGDWYVFATDASIDSVDGGDRCASAGLVNVAYGGETTFSWPAGTPGRDGHS